MAEEILCIFTVINLNDLKIMTAGNVICMRYMCHIIVIKYARTSPFCEENHLMYNKR